ncbi:MAG: tRNA(Ile)-lysidine synthase [Myxococcota bacterium]|jgi:tRNA(Ile)-lysidine synthase
MITQVSSQLNSFGPYSENSKVLLACSGGADSTFLAHAYLHAAKNHALPEAIIAVIDHAQYAESSEDTHRIAERYRKLGFSVITQRLDCDVKINENEMRNRRYAALQQIATENKASQIFLAHHADDQAETVLQRIMRGTGLNGLVGMPARRPLTEEIEICRPLLEVRSAAMRDYLTQQHIGWHEDLSNSDVEYATRNKIRHQLLPQLAEIATGDPVKALLKLADEATQWQAAQHEILAQQLDFADLPAYLRRQLIRRELLAEHEVVSPQRLLDLEGALMKKGSAVINQALRFSTSGGKLLVVARR